MDALNVTECQPNGAVTCITSGLKEIVLEALDRAGGADYLARQANENPAAFLALEGRVLPLTPNAKQAGSFTVVTSPPIVRVG